jgi:WD40 repeat protein
VTRNQQWVAIGGRDGTVQLWDLASEDPRRTPRRFAGSGDVKRVEFDDVGRSLSVASDHAVRVWSLSQLHGAADPIVLSTPRGVLRQDRWLVAAADDDRYINRWDLHDPAPSVPTVIADGPGVEPAALSRDGRWLASWDREQRLRLWRLESRDQPALLWSPAMVKAPKGYRSRPPVAFSADGRWLAAGFFDGSVQLRNLPSYRTTTVQGHDSDVVRVAFTDDGRWLLTADNKGRGCLWRVAVEKMGPPQCEGGVQDLQVGGGGRWLFATTRRSIRLWSLAFDQPWARPLVLESGFKDVSNVLIDPDGRWVIASGDSLVLWRRHPQGFSDGQTLTKLYDPLIRLSPDGRWLAAVGPSREPVLWDLLAPRAPQSIPRARSPDFGDTLSFYGPRPGSAALAVLRDASGSNQIIGFVDPSSLAANRARAWIDLPEGARVSHTRLAGFLTPGHYHVSGDGRWLVSIEQSTTSLQRLRAQELERLACEIADRNLTDEEWARYFPDQKHRATCPQLAAVKPKS